MNILTVPMVKNDSRIVFMVGSRQFFLAYFEILSHIEEGGGGGLTQSQIF